MARKKRKAARDIPPKSSPSLSAAAGKWSAALPAFGALALLLAWLSFLGALSAGHLNWNDIMDGDTVHPWRMLNDIRGGAAALADYEHPGSWMWIPDFAILWGLYLAGADVVFGALALPLLQTALSAAGWILVCDFLFGKSPVRRAAILILHALPFLIVSHNGLDLFYHQTVPRWRYGIWAATPWLWWLSLRALTTAESGRRQAPALLALAAATAAVAAGELLLLSWFVAPAIAAALGLCILGKMRRNEFAVFVAALLAGFFIGRALGGELGVGRHGQNLRFDFAHFAAIFGVARHILATLAARNPVEGLVWAGFVVFALAGLFAALSGRRTGGWPLEPPKSRGAVFVALLIPAAMLIPLLAVLPQIHFGVQLDPGKFYASSHRYFLPLLYLPLFVGWALLPWKFPALSHNALPLCAAAAVLVAVAATPRALSISAQGLDPFASPFHKCFAQNARRLNWRAGISANGPRPQLRENPDAGIERMMIAGVRRGQGAPEISLLSISHNYWRYGEFQFVGLNGFNGRVFHTAPAAAEPGCPAERAAECVYPGHYGGVVDDASVRAVFGEPAEVIDCQGFGFFHYDPPLRFDPPDNPKEWIVKARP